MQWSANLSLYSTDITENTKLPRKDALLLRQARELIVLKESSLLSIAEHLGYCSAANFSTAFRNRFGCTPSELRKQQQPAEKTITTTGR